MAKVVVLLTW